jgi:hypothetical protein
MYSDIDDEALKDLEESSGYRVWLGKADTSATVRVFFSSRNEGTILKREVEAVYIY